MEVYEAATKRRSIREFKDTPLSYDVLEKCVDAARLAPTAGNGQVCEHIVVDDEKIVPGLFDAVGSWFGQPRPKEGWPPGRRPKAYIITLINTLLESELGVGRANINFDVGIAVENMVLVAFERGVGSCIITSFKRGTLKEVLNIPDKYDIAIMLALGYPDESPVLEMAASGSIKRWIDSKGMRHIPKRELRDIIHRNRFP